MNIVHLLDFIFLLFHFNRVEEVDIEFFYFFLFFKTSNSILLLEVDIEFDSQI